MKKVVVIGDVFADMTAEIEGFPERGGRTYGSTFVRHEGGTAGNIAAGLAVLGIPTTILAGIGEDEAGDYLIDGMKKAGVNTEYLNRKQGLNSGTTAIFTDSQGERNIYVLVRGSAYEKIEPEDIERLEEISPDIICFTGVIIGAHPAEDSAIEAARRWKGRAELYFDPNLCYPADQVPSQITASTRLLADLCDVVLTGETEQKVLGLSPDKGQTYVVKCGGKGSKLLDENGEIIYSIPATHHRPVDTTGAGDTFMAAFVAARIYGKDMQESMKYASAAAGISVTKKGARNMPSSEMIEEAMKEYENL